MSDKLYDDKKDDPSDVAAVPVQLDGKHEQLNAETDAVESDLVVLSQDVDAVYDRAVALTEEETIEILEEVWRSHENDPNFPAVVRSKIEYFLSGDASTLENYALLLEEMKIEAALCRFSSPYPEVRAVASCEDDMTTPALTARVWIMGIFWCGLGSFINQFFSLRQPALTFTVNEVQLLTFPLGKFFELVMPTRVFRTFGKEWTLNPGRFNEKEHMLLTIMANVGIFAPYTLDLVIIQRLPLYYNQEWAGAIGYQLLTSLSIQLIGMGAAGATRRFIVYPEHAIWQVSLASIALNKSFHDKTNVVANGWRISRMRFFLIAFAAMFIYYLFPGGLFQAISYFNWITWIAPSSVWVAAVFGQISGVGLNPLVPTLDWSQFLGTTCMILPFFSTLNQFIGTLISAPIILLFWYTNVWNSGFFPLVSNRIFDNAGELYNVTLILDESKNLDVEKYQAYSKPYMAASNLVLYAAFFAIYSATIVHTILYNRKEISTGFVTAYRSIRAGQKGNASFNDRHNQLMSKYPEVPELWYLGMTLVAIAFGCAGLTAYPTGASVSSIFFGLALCIILVIPIGIIYAVTGVQITLNVFAEFIGGLIYPGNAISMNYFKSFGVMTTSNALLWAQDLKLAHYCHIAQRKVFYVQVVGLLISAFVSTGIVNYQMTSIPGVCTPDQPQHFICNSVGTFFTASVFWGTLGPKRVFGGGGIYPLLLLGFLVGFVLPFPFYFYSRKNPKSWVARVHIPVILYGALIWGPYSNMSNVYPGLCVAYFFQVFVKRRYLAWWSKYNYVLATAFGAAIPLSGILIFVALSNTDLTPSWAGNNIPFEGCDANGCTRLAIPEIGYIGAEPGTHAWA